MTEKPVALEFPIELEFGYVDFCGGRKTGEPREKTPRARTRANNKLNPLMTPGPSCEPGPHRWEASATTTALPLLPQVVEQDTKGALIYSIDFAPQTKLQSTSHQIAKARTSYIDVFFFFS